MAETQEKFKDTLSREDIEKIVEMRVDDELRSDCTDYSISD